MLQHWEYARHVVEPEGLLLVHVMLLLEVLLLQLVRSLAARLGLLAVVTAILIVVIPFSAIQGFFDPSVQFGLQFQTEGDSGKMYIKEFVKCLETYQEVEMVARNDDDKFIEKEKLPQNVQTALDALLKELA